MKKYMAVDIMQKPTQNNTWTFTCQIICTDT